MSPDIYVHIDNVLFFFAYLFKEILWLRVLSSLACVASILYHYHAPDTPLWASIYWDLGFIAINAYHIAILIKERTGITFSDRERELFNTMFSNFPPVDFHKILKVAQWQTLEPGQIVLTKGQVVESLSIILRGSVAVDIAPGKEIILGRGDFLGEFAYITGETASATLTVRETTALVSWKLEDLHRLFKRYGHLESSFRGILSNNLVRKLLYDNSKAAEQAVLDV